jgi:DNA-binding transcriptional ArsR family regulator
VRSAHSTLVTFGEKEWLTIASVSELAAPMAMSLAAVMQHLQVLEESRLLSTEKQGGVRACTIDPDVLARAEAWLTDRRTFLGNQFDRLGARRGRPQIQKTQTEKAMTKAIHGSFTIDRIYDASPARVFKAFADPKSKARWFVGEGGWQEIKRELDFRPGGQEVVHGKFPNGSESRFVARYHEIVPNERLV